MTQQVFVKQSTLVKALSHPTRLEIIHILRHHVLTVSQITAMLGVSQSLTSQHLKALKIAQIVSSTRSGKELYYSISDNRILVACDAILSLVRGDLPKEIDEPKVIDPICGMELTPSTAPLCDNYNGIRHYFCGKGCLSQFINTRGHSAN